MTKSKYKQPDSADETTQTCNCFKKHFSIVNNQYWTCNWMSKARPYTNNQNNLHLQIKAIKTKSFTKG